MSGAQLASITFMVAVVKFSFVAGKLMKRLEASILETGHKS